MKKKLKAEASSRYSVYPQLHEMHPKVDAFLGKAKKWREEFGQFLYFSAAKQSHTRELTAR